MENSKKKILLLTLMSSLLLNGCGEKERAVVEDYDIIENGQSGITEDDLKNALEQTIDVPGEEFKLIANFSCDDFSKRVWRITSDKFLYINMHTSGLKEGTKVYIDNIHIDTSIKSVYAVMDGILQDSMDDRVHNALMLGFPIGNDTYYYGVNAIEGCNKDFIEGTAVGYYSYYSKSFEQKRYTETDYLELGVYGNKISVVVDLLVKHENETEYRNISVKTDFVVKVPNALEEQKTLSKKK